MAIQLKYVDPYPDWGDTKTFDNEKEAFVFLAEQAAINLEESEPDFDDKIVQKLVRCIENRNLDGLLKSLNKYLEDAGMYWQMMKVDKEDFSKDLEGRLQSVSLKIEKSRLDWLGN